MSDQVNHAPAKVFRWVALFVAWVALALALMGYMNNFHNGTVPSWSASESTVLPGLGALGAAVCIFDWVRNSKSAAGNWPIAKHFLVAGLSFVGFFVAQYIGVRMVIASHVG